MAIKVIAQRREVKLGKNPGMKFVMRFNLNKNQTVMASRILADALESGLIKMKDPETESKRYTSYIPYYG